MKLLHNLSKLKNRFLTRYHEKYPVVFSLFCMMMFLFFSFEANAQTEKVSLKFKNVAVEKVLNAIESQTSYRFLYNKSEVDVARKVSLSVKNQPLSRVLSDLFTGSEVSYKIVGGQIVLNRETRQEKSKNLPPVNSSEHKKVTGIVTDAKGEPVIGATIKVKGSSQGTVTNLDGEFSINTLYDSILEISYIGYKTQELSIGKQSNIKVILHEDNKTLNEIVVIGYATGSKYTISGVVEKVNKEDLNQGVVLNPMDALKGKVSGVYISQNGGDPSATPNIRVRGTTSLSGGSDPLVIIDGVYGDLSMLKDLPSADIESVTILKDASETAQYGSRGASGVIVITTKKGKFGLSEVDYEGQFGFNSIFKNLRMLSATDFLSTASKLGLTAENKGGATDWINTVERNNGITQNHNLSFSSGNKLSNMRASLGVLQRQGIIRNTDMINYSAKFDGMQLALNKRLRLEVGSIASENEDHDIYDLTQFFFSAATFNPTYQTVKNSNNVWDENYSANYLANPLGQLEVTNKNDKASLNLHGRAVFTIVDGLDLSTFGSYTYIDSNYKRYIPNDVLQGKSDDGSAYLWKGNYKNLMGNIQLDYSKDFALHHIDALALVEGQIYNTFTSSELCKGFETNYFKYNNLEAGANVTWGDITSYASKYKIFSYMARLNYVYASKYIATVNLRRDGSSKLGNGNKWGTFPSASLAWVISNETFMKYFRTINNFKLRIGYGVTGNQDAIEPYNSLSLMEPNGVTLVNGSKATTYAVTSNNNPNLKWEIKQAFDIGIDLSMFNNRLNFITDYYRSTTKNLLYTYNVPVPPFTYTSLLANIGKMSNNGLDLTINGDIIKTKDLSFSANINLSFLKNKLISLHGTYKGEELTTSKHIAMNSLNTPGLTFNTGISYLIEGQPIGVFYLPHCTGIDEKGQYIMEDLDKNGTVDLSDDGDRKVCGQPTPKAYLGMGYTLKYKNWDLSTQFDGAFGQKIYNATAMTYSNMSNFPNYNVLANAPSLNNGKGIYDIQVSDYWLEKGDYLNFEYAVLGYSLSKKQLKNVSFIKSLRLALSVNNICTITGYKGLTPMINSASIVPESGGSGSMYTLGIDDRRIYPLTRTFMFSISIKF